ncbi:MAG: hypothetical protein IJH90_03450 [Mogibacterium sp.]|nr:hypothetical protein [Mogibacterium sp.]
MITYIILILLVFWSILFTVARFFKYFRIVKDYKDETTATVVKVSDHVPGHRKEPPAKDVVIEYEMNGEPRTSEIIIPLDQAGNYEIGTKLDIRYYQASNGAVHVASAGDGPRKLMYGYLAAIILELVIYVIIWMIMF